MIQWSPEELDLIKLVDTVISRRIRFKLADTEIFRRHPGQYWCWFSMMAITSHKILLILTWPTILTFSHSPPFSHGPLFSHDHHSHIGPVKVTVINKYKPPTKSSTISIKFLNPWWYYIHQKYTDFDAMNCTGRIQCERDQARF